MPLLFSLGRHAALDVRRRLRVGERLIAFLDDRYVTTTPERVGIVDNILEQELHRHARIHIHVAKTQVWNAAGVRPPACDQLERRARVSDPARVWKGSDTHGRTRSPHSRHSVGSSRFSPHLPRKRAERAWSVVVEDPPGGGCSFSMGFAVAVQSISIPQCEILALCLCPWAAWD